MIDPSSFFQYQNPRNSDHRARDHHAHSQPPPRLKNRSESTTRPAIKRLTHGSVFMMLAMSLTPYIVQCPYPATSVTTVSANTGTGFPTTLGYTVGGITAWRYNGYVSWPSTGVFVAQAYNTCNTGVFDKNGNALFKIAFLSNCRAAVLKDPLKLLIGSESDTVHQAVIIQLNAGVYSMQTNGPMNAGFTCGRSYDIPGTNYIACCTNVPSLRQIDTVMGIPTGTSLNLPSFGNNIMLGPYSNSFLITGSEAIVDRTNFALIKTFAPPGTSVFGLLDSLNVNNFFWMSWGGTITRIDISASTGGSQVVTGSTSSSNGGNFMSNFGPYQYVVTTLTGNPTSLIHFINKVGTMSVSALSTGVNIFSQCFGFAGVEVEMNNMRIYIGTVDFTNNNFQSYYLTVDRCVNKDASNVCTECLSPYYRVTTSPGNLCQIPAEFPAGIGIVVSTTPLLADVCSPIGCTACSANYLTCTACDTAAGWYLSGTTCLSSIGNSPAIPNLYGANTATGMVVTCQDTHCLLCKASYTTCTGCDTASSWYLSGTTCQSPTLSPQIASGFGANTATGMVVACQDTHCLVCKASYTTCTGCNTGSSWYLSGTTCQSPTLSPQIASGFGANTVTGMVVACQDTNCLLCKASYTTCTGCNTGSSWYLSGTTCQSPTLSPQIASGFGANTVTGMVVACQDTHCLLCKASYTTCTGCNTGSSWYLSGTTCQSPTLSPQIASGFGANTVTGMVVACQDTNCLLCKASYTTCTGCNTGSSWYLSGTTCQSPTLSPQIASGFGANTATGMVVACQDTNCLLCKASYTTCTGCNTGSSWYLSGTTCQSPTLSPQIASGFGANTATGMVVACQDTNCLLCKASYTTCTGCNTGSSWYLSGTTCQSPTLSPQIASGFGANTATGMVVACQDTNCLLCKASYTTCTGCNTGSSWYLSGTTCQSPTLSPQIASGFGANTATGMVVACQDTNCLLCKASYTTCTGCNTGSSWYLNGNNCQSPTLSPQIPDFFGANIGTGFVVPCFDTNCKFCKSDKSSCTGCDTGNSWFLSGTTCQSPTLSPQIPDFFGADLITGAVVPCADPTCKGCKADINACTSYNCVDVNCLECLVNSLTCASCNTADQWYLLGPSCFSPIREPLIPDKYGVDPSARVIVPCSVGACVDCSANYQICTECDQANGYVLVDGTCQRITIISTAIKPTKADVDLSWRESVPETNIPVTTSTVLTALEANKARFRLYLKEDDRTLGKDDFQLAVAKYADFIVLDFTLPQDLPKEQYTVTLLGFDFNVTGGSPTQNITAMIQNNTASYILPLTPKLRSQTNQLQGSASLGMTGLSAPDSFMGLCVLGSLVSLDPSGSFFRFTKILQIVNKLYFININYGKRLEAFLAKSAIITTTDPRTDSIDRPEYTFSVKNFRGKLSKYKITLSGIALPLMMYKIIVYVLSWLVRGAKRLLLDNCLMGKVGIYSCYYANKVHLIIFNLVFIDFIWLAPRTLMHSRGLSKWKFNLTIFVMCLIAADLCLLLAHLLDDRIWRRALEHYTSLKEFCPAPELSSKEKRNDSSMNALKKPDQPSEQDGPNQPQTKQINYKRTYFEIDFNVHLMDMATNTLSLTKDVYDSMIVRLLVAQLWFRVPLISLAIMTTQYANCFGITIMLSIELSKLFATIYAYLKYKYLKNIICLLMEVSQAVFLAIFYSMALLISPKRFDETISDIYQDAGIWIVIASCVAEYLLLLTYIGVAAYDFFKNRRMMKKMNVQRKQQSLIKYSEKPAAPLVPGQLDDGSLNKLNKVTSLKNSDDKADTKVGHCKQQPDPYPPVLRFWPNVKEVDRSYDIEVKKRKLKERKGKVKKVMKNLKSKPKLLIKSPAKEATSTEKQGDVDKGTKISSRMKEALKGKKPTTNANSKIQGNKETGPISPALIH